MIFIWSNDGGPLQYAGLCLFALQFLLPQIMNVYSTTLELQYHYNIPIISVTVAFLFIIVAIAAVMVWMIGSDHNVVVGGADVVDEGNSNGNSGAYHNYNNNAGTTSANSNNNNYNPDAPLGSASNPIVVDDDENDNNNNNNTDFWARNNAANEFTSLLDSANNIARRILHTLSPMHLMIAAGFILPISMMIPILRDGGASSALWKDSNTLQLSLFAFLAHSFMAVGAYRILRQVLNDGNGGGGGDFGTFPGMRRGAAGGGRRRGAAARRYTVGEIESMLRKVPVEEFVSPEELRAGACSISKMKRMLVNRGASDAIERCIDKSDLLEEIEKVRKYNEECTICTESYQEGDPLRVLKCQHEFHLHCFDRWIYTFATDPRRGNSKPSCPLCKTALCD